MTTWNDTNRKNYYHPFKMKNGNDRKKINKRDADTINGMGYDDDLTGSGKNNTIDGGWGNDTMRGAGGNDTIHGRDGWDDIYGGSGNDWMDGDNRGDDMFGGSGNDTMYGGDYGDQMIGGSGNDWIYGQNDNDFLVGDSGNDYIDGGNGNDTLTGGYYAYDAIHGGIYTPKRGVIATYSFSGTDAPESFIGGSGSDTLTGGGGADTFNLLTNPSATPMITDFTLGIDKLDLYELVEEQTAQVSITGGFGKQLVQNDIYADPNLVELRINDAGHTSVMYGNTEIASLTNQGLYTGQLNGQNYIFNSNESPVMPVSDLF
ncbi:calcium-binding protein [Dapis sp. BLCC M229]|uniref:calcium-binding protein n=1 Tax=Dapis sp. BLCC M229 TaxID=3400188 RepID=UPI003CF89897